MNKEKRTVRFNQYVDKLLEERKKEEIKVDVINQMNLLRGEGLTSPTSATSTEDTRLLMDYMDRSNLYNISNRKESVGKDLKLRRFFRLKRNHQVEVYSKWGREPIYTEGKVSAIGRDFVMLSNLKTRIWIPYRAIESANIPFGIPNYSNTHQHFIYDNNYRNKLIYHFGETVSKRDILKQQFFEETFHTNLQSWCETWVELFLDNNEKKIGKMKSVTNKTMILAPIKKEEEIPMGSIQYVRTIRLFTIWKSTIKGIARFFKK
ncbi:hypothetical protein [Salirhabdus sp. Marseille-P4669]|uniref:hypothetical protein n=1 Tax=Salirhabdus sp. Marseille-P4669 TaxID=2042310 RepID=UPI000C7A86AF|nr:hypothetical protein [Salirhabdus sp. Marseille-P4669]